jgi:hypothetical protein
MSARALDWAVLADRGLVAAFLYGLGPRGAPRLVVGPGPDLAAATPGAADLVVTVDAPELDGVALGAARRALAPGGAFAVMVSSASAVALLPARPFAPPISAARIRQLVDMAGAAELVLVEPEIALLKGRPAAPAAVDRAVFATFATGATARPLVFVDAASAPKRLKLREDRALDGWITLATRDEPRGAATSSPLLRAALTTLARSEGPMCGKDLLRESRAHLASGASAGDGPALAKELVRAWLHGLVDLHASVVDG